jgi:hypothetical protein
MLNANSDLTSGHNVVSALNESLTTPEGTVLFSLERTLPARTACPQPLPWAHKARATHVPSTITEGWGKRNPIANAKFQSGASELAERKPPRQFREGDTTLADQAIEYVDSSNIGR